MRMLCGCSVGTVDDRVARSSDVGGAVWSVDLDLELDGRVAAGTDATAHTRHIAPRPTRPSAHWRDRDAGAGSRERGSPPGDLEPGERGSGICDLTRCRAFPYPDWCSSGASA